MNDSQSQILNALTGGANSSVDNAVSALQPILMAGLVMSIVLTIIFSIYLVVSYVHKWKVQSAILRIDKNLQRLVDAQIGPDVEEKPTKSPKNSIEQK